ncbi:MAG: ImmA/IrrE family metallo-endopeptidase [Mycobacterium sp.]|nr:ImmA/IrrE family metallo-endopeptidase [Mycobacterium sp.]
MTIETVAEIRDRARRDAQAVLDLYWSERPMPVDPVVIARDLGLSVFSAQLGDDVFGMLVGSKAGADMYLDKDQAPARFRFTCAHEVGHYVDHTSRLSPELSESYVDRRSDDDRGKPDEIYANEFAGSLLMPAAEMRACIGRGMTDLQMAVYFDVSLQALRYRKSLLGLNGHNNLQSV